MNNCLTEVEAKYAKQLMQQESISEKDMTALAAMHKANMEAESIEADEESEKRKARLEFWGKILAASIAAGSAIGINAASRRDARNMLRETTEFEKTGNLTTTEAKGIVKRYFDVFSVK